MLVLFSYRNQSIDLLCKSVDWLYMRATLAFNGLKWFVLIFCRNRVCLIAYVKKHLVLKIIWVCFFCCLVSIFLIVHCSRHSWYCCRIYKKCCCGKFILIVSDISMLHNCLYNFLLFSAIPCWLKILGVCAESFWIRADFMY